ncbi:MAG: methyltransferase domain-containing protein [Chryseolinea sp.]
MNSPQINNFDALAGIYDTLAKVVFGRSIKDAQCVMLSELSGANTILIIGGGTGWLLDEVLKINQTSQIWYVDASSNMVSQARRRCERLNSKQVKFVQGTENELPDQPTFDAVIANFYFDMFSPASLQVVMKRIKESMEPGAVLIATDFTKSKRLWHALLLGTMYRFFRIASKLEAGTLPPWQSLLVDSGFKEESAHKFYDGFIEARKYVLR